MSDKTAITEALLKEKSLWAVYRLAWKLKLPWGALAPSILLTITLMTFSVLTIENSINLTNQARQVIDLGITLTSTILGFLIAGFTIFASLTNPKLFVAMANIQDEESTLSWLKKTFVIFMHVFIHYTSFLVVVVLIKILTFPQGVVSSLLSNMPNGLFISKGWIAAFGFSILSGWLFYLLLLLGRFIFNTYHACMLSISVTNENLIDE
jgi:phosphoglycerol transferase MdoB-like AlkP superfamily enzyme